MFTFPIQKRSIGKNRKTTDARSKEAIKLIEVQPTKETNSKPSIAINIIVLLFFQMLYPYFFVRNRLIQKTR